MKKTENIDYVRKTICFRPSLLKKLEALAKKENRKFSPFMDIWVERMLNDK